MCNIIDQESKRQVQLRNLTYTNITFLQKNFGT